MLNITLQAACRQFALICLHFDSNKSINVSSVECETHHYYEFSCIRAHRSYLLVHCAFISTPIQFYFSSFSYYFIFCLISPFAIAIRIETLQNLSAPLYCPIQNSLGCFPVLNSILHSSIWDFVCLPILIPYWIFTKFFTSSNGPVYFNRNPGITKI